MPLHEWKETFELNYSTGLYDLGTEHSPTTCPFKYQGQYYDSEVELCYNRFRYYHPETGRYISEDPIGFLSGEANFFAYVSDTNAWVDLLGLDSENIYFDDFNQAMFGTKDKHGKKQKEGALDWLLKRGFKADIQNISRVKVIGEPHGMKTADGKVGFRIEFDEKVGAHINVFDKKEKDTPHFIFKASEKTVKKIRKRYRK